MEAVTIPAAVRGAIVAHARESAPFECCGLIAGRDGAPTRTVRCANVSTTPQIRYRIEPREQLAALRSIEDEGEELFGIYHSHPATEAFPSATDRAESHYPEAVYVLVSLRGDAPELRAFRILTDGEKAVRELVVR